jgi:hypothetical protein
MTAVVTALWLWRPVRQPATPDRGSVPVEAGKSAAPYRPGSTRSSTSHGAPRACAGDLASFHKRRSNPSLVRRCDSWASCTDFCRSRAKRIFCMVRWNCLKANVRTRGWYGMPPSPAPCGGSPFCPIGVKARPTGCWGGLRNRCGLRPAFLPHDLSRSSCGRSPDPYCAGRFLSRNLPKGRHRRSFWSDPRLWAWLLSFARCSFAEWIRLRIGSYGA